LISIIIEHFKISVKGEFSITVSKTNQLYNVILQKIGICKAWEWMNILKIYIRWRT